MTIPQFTYEIQRELDPQAAGYVSVEKDMVYMSGEHWTLASPFQVFGEFVRPDLRPFVRHYLSADRATMDLQVLTAKHVTNGREARGGYPGAGEHTVYDFMPHDGLSALPVSTYANGRGGRSEIEKGVPSLFGADAVDLSDLWDQGKVKPLYVTEAGKLSLGRAEAYEFRIIDPSTGLTRLVHVQGHVWRGMMALGLRARVSPRRYNNMPPAIGLVHPEDPSRLFGVMDQLVNDSRFAVRTTDDGRTLVRDAHTLSWVDDADLIPLMANRNAIDTRQPPLQSLAEIDAGKGNLAAALQGVVEILRWRRLTEPDIESWIFSVLPVAYNHLAEALAAELRSTVNSHRGATTSWEVSQVMSAYKTTASNEAWFRPYYPAAADVLLPAMEEAATWLSTRQQPLP